MDYTWFKTMPYILLAVDSKEGEKVVQPLQQEGFTVSLQPQPPIILSEPLPYLVVTEVSSPLSTSVRNLLQQCRENSIPVLLALPPGEVLRYDVRWGGDDFITEPLFPQELVSRVRQLLYRTRGLDSQRTLRRGDLMLDLERYEVWVADRQVYLTFKEYELLKLLASNPGKVFGRDDLLNRIWGYQYFGGTRTVDVHIRRLRSKLEDAQHSFIDTVRNVGYRFKD